MFQHVVADSDNVTVIFGSDDGAVYAQSCIIISLILSYIIQHYESMGSPAA